MKENIATNNFNLSIFRGNNYDNKFACKYNLHESQDFKNVFKTASANVKVHDLQDIIH